jgi:hypothetical protein
MASALITTFLAAKMRDANTSVALYAVSSDVDGAKIAQEMGIRFTQAMVGMLKTTSVQLTTDPQLVDSMLQGVMAGISRGSAGAGGLPAGSKFDAKRIQYRLRHDVCARRIPGGWQPRATSAHHA